MRGSAGEEEELDVLRAVANQQGAVLVTGISTKAMLADVQARARQSGTGGQCLYHTATVKDIGSGMEMKDVASSVGCSCVVREYDCDYLCRWRGGRV